MHQWAFGILVQDTTSNEPYQGVTNQTMSMAGQPAPQMYLPEKYGLGSALFRATNG